MDGLLDRQLAFGVRIFTAPPQRAMRNGSALIPMRAKLAWASNAKFYCRSCCPTVETRDEVLE